MHIAVRIVEGGAARRHGSNLELASESFTHYIENRKAA